MTRTFRTATIALLVAGIVAAIALIAWSLYIRSATYGPGAGRADVRTGLELAARLEGTYLIALGAFALLGIGLAIAMIRRHAWPFVAAALLSICGIAAVWYGRSLVVELEDPRYVSHSPWVHAATHIAIASTAYLGVLATTSALSWVRRRAATPPPAAP